MELFFEWELSDGIILPNTVVNEGKDLALQLLLKNSINSGDRLTLTFTNKKDISIDDIYDANDIVGAGNNIFAQELTTGNNWEKVESSYGVRYRKPISTLDLAHRAGLTDIYRLALIYRISGSNSNKLVAYSAILPGAPITIPANGTFSAGMTVGLR